MSAGRLPEEMLVLTVHEYVTWRLPREVQPDRHPVLVALENDLVSTHSDGDLGKQIVLADVPISLKDDEPLATVRHNFGRPRDSVVIVVDRVPISSRPTHQNE